MESQAKPNGEKAFNLRDASMKHWETDSSKLRSPVLDVGGKTGGPGENLQKKAWTGNQMHLRIGNRTWDSLVSERRYAMLTCLPQAGCLVSLNIR